MVYFALGNSGKKREVSRVEEHGHGGGETRAGGQEKGQVKPRRWERGARGADPKVTGLPGRVCVGNLGRLKLRRGPLYLEKGSGGG